MVPWPCRRERLTCTHTLLPVAETRQDKPGSCPGPQVFSPPVQGSGPSRGRKLGPQSPPRPTRAKSHSELPHREGGSAASSPSPFLGTGRHAEARADPTAPTEGGPVSWRGHPSAPHLPFLHTGELGLLLRGLQETAARDEGEGGHGPRGQDRLSLGCLGRRGLPSQWLRPRAPSWSLEEQTQGGSVRRGLPGPQLLPSPSPIPVQQAHPSPLSCSRTSPQGPHQVLLEIGRSLDKNISWERPELAPC